MKLAKALKEKNRLVGDIKRLQAILQRENSRPSTSTSKFDLAEVVQSLADQTENLIKLKAAIFAANAGIYKKILRMGELKAHIAFLATLDTRDGEFLVNNYGSGTTLTETRKAYYRAEVIDGVTVDFQKEIAQLQDEIDEYNGITDVAI
jgi:hypothetical protein